MCTHRYSIRGIEYLWCTRATDLGLFMHSSCSQRNLIIVNGNGLIVILLPEYSQQLRTKVHNLEERDGKVRGQVVTSIYYCTILFVSYRTLGNCGELQN